MYDFSTQTTDQLSQIKTIEDFCTNWKATWRGIAIAAQSVLSIFFPPGAKVLGFLITIADTYCTSP